MRALILKGDFVKTWFDTGAFGMSLLYGIVRKAGPKQYTVEWESGIRNRLCQDYPGIYVVSRESLERIDPNVLHKLENSNG